MSWLLVKDVHALDYYVHVESGTKCTRVSTVCKHQSAPQFEFYHKKWSKKYHDTHGQMMMDIGTELHQIFAGILSGVVFKKMRPEYILPTNNFMKLIKFHEFEMIEVEATYGDVSHQWAGTIDAVGNINSQCPTPGIHIVDHKTGSFSKSHWLQVCAYHNFYCKSRMIDPQSVSGALFIVQREGKQTTAKFKSGKELVEKFEAFKHLGMFYNKSEMPKYMKG